MYILYQDWSVHLLGSVISLTKDIGYDWIPLAELRDVEFFVLICSCCVSLHRRILLFGMLSTSARALKKWRKYFSLQFCPDVDVSPEMPGEIGPFPRDTGWSRMQHPCLGRIWDPCITLFDNEKIFLKNIHIISKRLKFESRFSSWFHEWTKHCQRSAGINRWLQKVLVVKPLFVLIGSECDLECQYGMKYSFHEN